MTWLQPPGYVHTMISNTWAETTLESSAAPFPFAAQRSVDGKSLFLRAVNTYGGAWPFNVTLAGVAVSGDATVWTLGGAAFLKSDDNTPSAPTRIAPVQSTLTLAAGATSLAFTMEMNSFVIIVLPVQ
jgi:hypothetical protein